MEIASLSIGIAAITSTFNTCLDLYRAIQSAKSLSKDLERLSLFISIERERFFTFRKFLDQRAATLGLVGSDPAVQLGYGAGGSEAEAIRRNIVKQILNAIEDNLKATKVLIDKHSSTNEATESTTGSQGQTQQNTGLKPRRRFGWVINGEKQLEELVKNLRQLNDGLSTLAPSHVAARLDLDLLARVLGNEMGIIEEAQRNVLDDTPYSTLGRFGLIRQGYGQLERTSHSPQASLFGSTSYEIPFHIIKDLSGSYATGDRATALLSRPTEGDFQVLVEWRSQFRTSTDAMARPRLNGLVSILKEMSETSHSMPSLTFGILSCIGWTLPRANSMDSIGFVFQAPRNIAKPPISLCERIISDLTKKPPKAPALGVRFRLAQKLASIFASMIAVNCLHRGVRSHNILLFNDEELQNPYLAGFIEARADAKQEKLSSLIIDEKGDYDLYRPLDEAVPHQNTDTGYANTLTVQHDLYGLGVILLEIGLWGNVGNLRGRAGLRELHRKIIPHYVDQLSYRTGTYYRDAVLSCLNSIHQATDEAKLEYATGVVEKLARCSA